ncbi:alpha/beta hydrolase-fold protein [Vibrio sp.]|nr:alpha/beta hydrolase-fold protein [Vibrio sp.]
MAMITLAQSITANANASVFTKEINTDHSETVELSVSAPEYYRGIISSDKPLQSLVITNANGKIEKTLISSGETEAEVFWFAPDRGEYTFHIQPELDKQTHIKFDLHTLPLKNSQFVSPKQELTSPLLIETKQKIEQGLPLAEEHFWEVIQKKGTPLLEKSEDGNVLLTFLYHGKANNVRILGAPYDGHIHLSLIEGSTIWYKTYEVPEDTRFSYRVAPNVPQIDQDDWTEQRRAVLATTQPDPLNHSELFSQHDDLFGAASTVTLDKAPSDHYTRSLGNPKGLVTDYRYTSTTLNNTRKISIYQPSHHYHVSAGAPLLIVFDGDDYLTKVPTPTILDNLIAAGKVPPMRAVFINTPTPSLRAKELTPNNAYSHFLATEFKPWLCKAHNICPNAENTILTGSSFGGLSSMYIAFKHPDQFGKVLSQSGSFWWSPDAQKKPGAQLHNWVADQFEAAPHKAIDIYMNAGLFETKPAFSNILETNRHLYNILKNKGYHVDFAEVASGHDYFSWRVMLANGLITLFNQNKK